MGNPVMVYKSNALVEASYRLSVQEQRLVLACIGQVRRDEPVTDEVLYSVTAADLSGLSGIAVGDAYKELKEAALRLKRRDVRITQEPNGKGKKPKVMITGWVQTIFYIEGEGRVELRFTKDMLPYLTELNRQFTKYALEDVAKMTSAHAIRLYELLMQWDSTGSRTIEIDQLREQLQLEGRYPSIKDFKLRVLEPAVVQINAHSPLQVSWDQRKTGRKVTHLMFDYAPKTTAKAASKAPAKRKGGKLTDADISRLARPGESWEAARTRLNQLNLSLETEA